MALFRAFVSASVKSQPLPLPSVFSFATLDPFLTIPTSAATDEGDCQCLFVLAQRSGVTLHNLPFYAPYPHQVQWPSVSRSAMSPKNPTPSVATPCCHFFRKTKKNRTGNMDFMGATSWYFNSTKFIEDCRSGGGSGSIRRLIHAAFLLSTTPVPSLHTPS
jgi:hypothetical protein